MYQKVYTYTYQKVHMYKNVYTYMDAYMCKNVCTRKNAYMYKNVGSGICINI